MCVGGGGGGRGGVNGGGNEKLMSHIEARLHPWLMFIRTVVCIDV